VVLLFQALLCLCDRKNLESAILYLGIKQEAGCAADRKLFKFPFEPLSGSFVSRMLIKDGVCVGARGMERDRVKN
jgi:hypothetical protein